MSENFVYYKNNKNTDFKITLYLFKSSFCKAVWMEVVLVKKFVRKSVLSTLLLLILIFSIFIQPVYAYVTNGYHISTPGSVGIYCNNATYSNKIYTYAKKWNQCSELYLYESSTSVAKIHASVSGTSNGNYAVTYHHGNDDHSIVFYASWQSASDSIKNETVVHEFGHALGLAHTQSQNNNISVMRQYGFNYKAYPLSDDKAGISYIY